MIFQALKDLWEMVIHICTETGTLKNCLKTCFYLESFIWPHILFLFSESYMYCMLSIMLLYQLFYNPERHKMCKIFKQEHYKHGGSLTVVIIESFVLHFILTIQTDLKLQSKSNKEVCFLCPLFVSVHQMFWNLSSSLGHSSDFYSVTVTKYLPTPQPT